MLRTRENSDVFNSLDEIYLVFTSKKQISSMSIYLKEHPVLGVVSVPRSPVDHGKRRRVTSRNLINTDFTCVENGMIRKHDAIDFDCMGNPRAKFKTGKSACSSF